MSKADFIITKDQLTFHGYLRSSAVQVCAGKLLKQGIIIIPGSYGYCVAAYAFARETRERLISISGNYSQPVPIAFPSLRDALGAALPNRFLEAVLETLTPGPLHIRCKPNAELAKLSFFDSSSDGDQNSLGIFITDSPVERDVAMTSPHYVLASMPLEGVSQKPVQDFEEACALVEDRTSRQGNIGWGAVEGRGFSSGMTSVAVVSASGEVRLLKDGDLSQVAIEQAAQLMPSSDYSDWG